MTNPDRMRLLTSLIFITLVAGCASRSTTDSGPTSGSGVPATLPDDAVPRKEPRSRYGNGPYYEVYGVTYEVMNSSHGFKERGVASWYGKKFHGRPTSSQEPYDMYAMTAAHKTLPLPCYVSVRNLKNNKSIIVRVNDRGPFVDNRIIDLSYSAAIKLDMVKDGTGLVEITALSYDEPERQRGVATTTSTPSSSGENPKQISSTGSGISASKASMDGKLGGGLDALLSTCNMPKGIPVGTMSMGSHGAVNSALFAAAILALSDADLNERLIEYRRKQTAAIPEDLPAE